MNLRLRPLLPADRDLVFEWMRDPGAVRMAAFTAADPDDRAAFDAHLTRNLSNPDVINRGIERDGVLVGTIGSFTVDDDREITYWIDPAHWGEGIATGAVRLLLEIDSTRPLWARAAAGNAGSVAVLRRVGFVEVGRDSGWANGAGAETEEVVLRLDGSPSDGHTLPPIS